MRYFFVNVHDDFYVSSTHDISIGCKVNKQKLIEPFYISIYNMQEIRRFSFNHPQIKNIHLVYVTSTLKEERTALFFDLSELIEVTHMTEGLYVFHANSIYMSVAR